MELPAGEATPMLQPLPRPPRRHSQRLAVPASAQPPTLLVAHIEGIQVSCHIYLSSWPAHEQKHRVLFMCSSLL